MRYKEVVTIISDLAQILAQKGTLPTNIPLSSIALKYSRSTQINSALGGFNIIKIEI